MIGAQVTIACPNARHPVVRRLRASWRGLTGGGAVRDAERRTLIACSGGADSSALALALGGVRVRPVLAHVVHDLRPEAEVLSDRDAAAVLADRMGLVFAEARVRVAARAGNAEGNARRARYAALDELAAEHECPYIATAHHADDQLETVLMRLVRGSGPRGLAGIHPTRRLGHATLVRPMLTLTRAECRSLCGEFGWAWREDATNADEDRTRAAIRARVLPELKRLAPGVERRIGRAGAVLRDAGDLLEREARALEASGRTSDRTWRWARADLACAPESVVGEMLRAIGTRGGRLGADRLGQASIRPVVRAIRECRDRGAEFRLGRARARITGARVEISVDTEDARDG